MDRKTVGRRLRSWIVDAGMSQEQFAEQIGVGYGTAKSWAYGTRPIPFDRAYEICELFNKPLDELACRENKYGR